MKKYNSKKEAIKELRASGETELYIVTCRMQDKKEGTDLWVIYNKYDDAMKWINMCYVVDSLQPGFKEIDYKSLDEFNKVCMNLCVKICSFEWMVNNRRNTFIFERAA